MRGSSSPARVFAVPMPISPSPRNASRTSDGRQLGIGRVSSGPGPSSSSRKTEAANQISR